MSRKPSLINEDSVHLLRKLIQSKANLQCNAFSEIQQLQSIIRKETEEYLSIQTLNRFFGLIKNDFKPALATLNILAKYLNYDSFKEFELANKELPQQESSIQSSIEFIRLMLSNLEIDKTNDKSLQCIMRNICQMLLKHSYLADEVCLFMATNEYGRKYFFEQFINIDALDSYYGEGLKFYLTHAKEREQHFFAYALLSFRYFLTLRYDLFNYYYNKMLEFPISEVHQFRPSLIGRYYACHVLNAVLNNEPVEVHDEALIAFEHIKHIQNDNNEFEEAAYHFAESLVLAQEYEVAWDVFKSSVQTKNKLSQPETCFSVLYEMILLSAGYFSENISERKAIEQFERLQMHSKNHFSKDYFTFFSLLLGKALGVKGFDKTAATQWYSLIDKTGFVFFRNKWMTVIPEEVVLMEIKGKKIG